MQSSPVLRGRLFPPTTAPTPLSGAASLALAAQTARQLCTGIIRGALQLVAAEARRLALFRKNVITKRLATTLKKETRWTTPVKCSSSPCMSGRILQPAMQGEFGLTPTQHRKGARQRCVAFEKRQHQPAHSPLLNSAIQALARCRRRQRRHLATARLSLCCARHCVSPTFLSNFARLELLSILKPRPAKP